MAIPGYRYSGSFMAQAGGSYNPAKDNVGTLELIVDKLVPGAKEILLLSLQAFTVPGRKVENGDMHYLNGSVHYPKKPTPQEPIAVTWKDHPQAKSRSVIERWFRKIYDEETGLMLPPNLMKCTGFMVLLESDGTLQRAARLEGIYPLGMPETKIDYTSGEHLIMEVELSCDRVIWEPSLHAPI